MRLLALLAMVSSISLAVAMSIEREPVKVTHRNSGPKYDIDQDKLTPTNPENEQPSPPTTTTTTESSPRKQDNDNDKLWADRQPTPDVIDSPIGHMTMRRIFLIPLMSPRQEGEWSSSSSSRAEPQQEPPMASGNPDDQAGPFLARPLWPFSFAPARHNPHHRHMLGQDEASRSPSSANDNLPAASGEREAERADPNAPVRPLIDPIQMMIDMMHQALNSQFAAPLSPPSSAGDLNTNEASNPTSSDTRSQSGGELERPIKPTNETKEDVVEIDGKKYLRKTIVNRHVGENIIFMTKRLIFTPLNETDPNEASTTTLKPSEESTEIPASPSSSGAPKETATPVSAPTTTSETTRTEQPTEASTVGDSATSGEPMTTSSSSTTSTSTTERPEEFTTSKEALETVNKAAERLTESTVATITTN